MGIMPFFTGLLPFPWGTIGDRYGHKFVTKFVLTNAVILTTAMAFVRNSTQLLIMTSWSVASLLGGILANVIGSRSAFFAARAMLLLALVSTSVISSRKESAPARMLSTRRVTSRDCLGRWLPYDCKRMRSLLGMLKGDG